MLVAEMHDGTYISKRQPFQFPSDVTEDLSSNDKIDVPSMAPVAPVAPASKAAPVAPASKAPLKENSIFVRFEGSFQTGSQSKNDVVLEFFFWCFIAKEEIGTRGSGGWYRKPYEKPGCKIDFFAIARILAITHLDMWYHFGCPLATRTVMGWTLWDDRKLTLWHRVNAWLCGKKVSICSGCWEGTEAKQGDAHEKQENGRSRQHQRCVKVSSLAQASPGIAAAARTFHGLTSQWWQVSAHIKT